MMERHEAGDPGGSIVVCGSLSVTDGVPRIAHYAAAKGGIARSRVARRRVRALRDRVNMVLPGGPDEPRRDDARAEGGGGGARKAIPIPRMGTPEDCAGSSSTC